MMKCDKSEFIINSRWLMFDSQNINLFFLNPQYVALRIGNDIGLLNPACDQKLIIPHPMDLFHPFLLSLRNGLTFEEMLTLLPSEIKDKNSFIVELWQKRVII